MDLIKTLILSIALIICTSLVISSNFKIEITHHHDFSGVYRKPIYINIGNESVLPIKLDVNHTGFIQK